MEITLENIIPIPLKENLEKRPSQVWQSKVHFGPGTKVKIKAPSGTGKTTLVHFLYGLRADYTGTLHWDTKALNKLDADQVARYRQSEISVVFQDLRLFAHLTARENIELNRVLQPKEPYYPDTVIQEMATTLQVDHILDQACGICSYGEQQRVAIIRALVQPFSLLIMDEPFSHLDQNNAQKAAALIDSECDKRGAGLVLTDLEEDSFFNYNTYLSL
ncbi:ATP-binding cassette domain-containing protein [Arachidicoccus ginsenosidivorans]|jgi:putative ABC transport system ATP-binding protein|uniref:ATP-binding cassette domain-containing protein n=1 Tax=Arachidicoccus ginsenosidivorans TaxID=496057 RepID=A0A5B8VML4_9BACT|nr:ATP-binding cassette domain-containing protein [Arachidicoccus ginsenosidivorans]QEC72192.1 ATP-binding cassette domain-containing protein [Arachidicoccus ginsenosidivorans]